MRILRNKQRRERQRDKQFCSARIKTDIACLCWGWDSSPHLMLGAIWNIQEQPGEGCWGQKVKPRRDGQGLVCRKCDDLRPFYRQSIIYYIINQKQAAHNHCPKQKHTNAACPEGLCCKACRWPAAKLGILGYSKRKWTCLASTYPSVRRGKHVRCSRSSTYPFLTYLL